jgi:protein-S-isoprenylcysteine O-methyltransferase Ste14
MEMATLADQPRDNPGVIVFPPLIALAVLAIGVPLDLFAPFDLLNAVPPALRVVAGGAMIAVGLWIERSGEREMKRIGTNVRPSQPTLALATEGVFARTRNPLYVGVSLTLFGIAFVFALEWTPMLFALGLILLHYGVVLREERYLERKFGDDYRRYKERVARYWSPR